MTGLIFNALFFTSFCVLLFLFCTSFYFLLDISDVRKYFFSAYQKEKTDPIHSRVLGRTELLEQKGKPTMVYLNQFEFHLLGLLS